MKVKSWQIQRIHIILNGYKLEKEDMKALKEQLVRGHTNNRETSTTQLTYAEANNLIKELENKSSEDTIRSSSDRMRKAIIHMAHQMNWELPGGKADMEHIDNWCKAHSYLQKPLMEYAYKELPKLVSQFQLVYKDFLSKV